CPRNEQIARVDANDMLEGVGTIAIDRFVCRVNNLVNSIVNLHCCPRGGGVLAIADVNGHDAISIVGRDLSALTANDLCCAMKKCLVKLGCKRGGSAINQLGRVSQVSVQHGRLELDGVVAELQAVFGRNHRSVSLFPCGPEYLRYLVLQIVFETYYVITPPISCLAQVP